MQPPNLPVTPTRPSRSHRRATMLTSTPERPALRVQQDPSYDPPAGLDDPPTRSEDPLSQTIDQLGDLSIYAPSTLEEHPKNQGAVLQTVVNAYLAFKADAIMENTRAKLGLATSGIPAASEDITSATQSPARGKEMKAALLAKLRPPALTHAWEFWHDRQNRATVPSFVQDPEAATSPSAPEESVSEYEERLVKLESVTDVRMFWSVFNNFNLAALQLRDTIHLFHKDVKPLWEDPRNVKGGAWTFRVPKDKAQAWWQQLCLLAIGEVLQGAIDNSHKRYTFIDDICGLSYSVRFNSILITVWNRDAENTEGIERLRNVILENMPAELQLRDGAFFYKKHSEHAGFKSPEKPQ